MLASMVAPAGLAASTSEPVSTEAVISDVPPLKLTNVTHLFDIKHDFRQPSDLAVSKAGHIYVVDGVNNSIKVFGKKGDFLFAFGKKGRGPGEFNYPLGITLDGAGQVYIADSGNQRVQVFSAGGEFLYQIELPAKDGKLADPTDVAVMADGSQCFVVDNDHHYILVYDLAGRKLINTFGGPGIDKWEFRYPFQLSLYKEKYLYIVDVINTRVQVLTTEGKFFTFIGEWGVERGEFFRPKGVAVDHTGHAFVSDSYMGVVQVFDGGTGAFRSVVGDGETGGVKRFKTPVGLFIDHNDRLYVVEMFAEKISVYQIERSE
ncbi:MAG: NHL repeat-containing protein [Desulfobulbaceae bacterium]|nr:NHL repeat-containing protein [Desulfobulbaceae bacterium]HIJ79686.1 6-bladed beta-propeller [Deltaproteobacteria bacterium]